MKKMNRAISLLLVMVMLLGLVAIPSGAVNSFTDADLIKNTEAVAITSGIGLFAGTADGQFAPKAAVTRAQMATIIVKMLRGNEFNADAFKGVGVNPFPDTADFEGGWAEGYINACYQLGVVAGYGDGTFKPERELTTAEALTMVINALGIDPGPGEWPLNYMAKADAMKLYGDLATKPATNEPLTRDQLAVIVWEGLKYSPAGNNGYSVTVNGKTFTFDNIADAVKAVGDAGIGAVTEVIGQDSLASKVYEIKTASGWITGNEATGDECTVLTVATDSEELYAVESGLDMLGHYVTIYYREQYENEEKPGEVYTLVDESAVVTVKETISTTKAYKEAFGKSYSLAQDCLVFDENYALENRNTVTGYTAGSAAPTGSYILVDGMVVAYIAPVAQYVSYITGISKVEGEETVKINKVGAVSNKENDDMVVEYDGMADGDFVTYVKVAKGADFIYVLSPVVKVAGTVEKSAAVNVNGAEYNAITLNGTEYISFEPKSVTPGKGNSKNAVAAAGKLENNLAKLEYNQLFVLYLTKNGRYIGFEKSDGLASLSNAIYILESNVTREKNTYGQYTFACKAKGLDMTGAGVEIVVGTAKDTNGNGVYDAGTDETFGIMYNKTTDVIEEGFYSLSESTNSTWKKEGIKTLARVETDYSTGVDVYESIPYKQHTNQAKAFKGAKGWPIPVVDGVFADTLNETLFFTVQYDPYSPAEPLKVKLEVGRLANAVNLKTEDVKMLLARDPSTPNLYANILAFVNVVAVTKDLGEASYIYISDQQLREKSITADGDSYMVYSAESGKEKELVIAPDCLGKKNFDDGAGFYYYQLDSDGLVGRIGATTSQDNVKSVTDDKHQIFDNLGFLGLTGVLLRAENVGADEAGFNLTDDGGYDNRLFTSAAVIDLRTDAEIKASGVPRLTSGSQIVEALANDPGMVAVLNLFTTDSASWVTYDIKTVYIRKLVSNTVGLNSIVYVPDHVAVGDVEVVVAKSGAIEIDPTDPVVTVKCESADYDRGHGFYRYCVDTKGNLTLAPIIESFAGTAYSKKYSEDMNSGEVSFGWSGVTGWHDSIVSMTPNGNGYTLVAKDDCSDLSCSADCQNADYEHKGTFAIGKDTLIWDADTKVVYTADELHEMLDTHDFIIDYYCGSHNGTAASFVAVKGATGKTVLGKDCGGHSGWTAVSGAAITGGNYYLTSNVGEAITISGNTKLCLNGYNITGGVTVNSGNVELCNCNGNGDKFTVKTISGSGYGVTINGGTVTLDNNGIVCKGVKVGTGATFTMDDGAVSDNNGYGIYVEGTFRMNGGSVSGNSNSGVYVKGTFTMDGGSISGNTATNGGGVYVAANGVFTMNDGTILRHTITGDGGGVYIATNGTFTMNNGKIMNNTAAQGGGVGAVGADGAPVKYANFVMNGGEITANKTTGSGGGGVYVKYAKLTLNNGFVTNNSGKRGGGVFAASGSAGSMSGGEISHNDAGGTGYAGGISINCGGGSFVMSGGKIADNSAGTATMKDIHATNGTIKFEADATVGTLWFGYSSDITITGGTFESIVKSTDSADEKKGSLTVQGGTFYVDPTTYVPETGYKVMQSGSKYVVSPQTYTVTVDQPVGGTVTVYGNGQSSDSLITVPNGTEITIAAVPDANYQFSKYLVGGAEQSGSTFTVNGENITVSAVFDEIVPCEHCVVSGAVPLSGNSTLGAGTYYLADDYTATQAITVSSGEVVLCLNDKTLSVSDAVTAESFITVKGGAKLTICGGENGNGRLVGAGTCRGIRCDDYGTVLTMDGGTISGFQTNANNKRGGGVHVGTDATFYMNGGTITGNAAGECGGGVYVGAGKFFMGAEATMENNTLVNNGWWQGYELYTNGTVQAVTISGTINSSKFDAVYLQGKAGAPVKFEEGSNIDAKVTIGDFKDYEDVAVTIEGGLFGQKLTAHGTGSFVISGGKFSNDTARDTLAEWLTTDKGMLSVKNNVDEDKATYAYIVGKGYVRSGEFMDFQSSLDLTITLSADVGFTAEGVTATVNGVPVTPRVVSDTMVIPVSGIVAKAMDDEYTIVVTDGTNTLYSETLSVYKLAKEWREAGFNTVLMEDMINYGIEAQKAFEDAATMKPLGGGTGEKPKWTATENAGVTTGYEGKVAVTLSLKEQIELNIYVRDTKAASTKGSTSCVVTESGEEITLIKIDDIAVSQAKEPISFTVTMSDGSTFDVVYSIKDYVINALAASENAQSDLMVALQKYVDRAIASTK